MTPDPRQEAKLEIARTKSIENDPRGWSDTQKADARRAAYFARELLSALDALDEAREDAALQHARAETIKAERDEANSRRTAAEWDVDEIAGEANEETVRRVRAEADRDRAIEKCQQMWGRLEEAKGDVRRLVAERDEARKERDEFPALWECPNCAFTFDACHEDDKPGGGYSCPLCGEARAEAERDRLAQALRDTHALVHRGLPYPDSHCPACAALASMEGGE